MQPSISCSFGWLVEGIILCPKHKAFHRRKVTLETSATSAQETRLLYDRKGAARQLSISVRSLDYLIAGKQLDTSRIGKKVMISHGITTL
jgi:hypothetical protein